MKAVALALLTCMVWAAACPAAGFGSSPPSGLAIGVNWQEAAFVPRRIRNHCGFENFTGRSYGSDHCGNDYQFYYCSKASFGCCHLGRGYCDVNGLLRCHP